MINHVTLYVSDFEKSKSFYKQALSPLGYRLLDDDSEHQTAGFGIRDIEGERDLWIRGKDISNTNPSLSCLAFQASNKQMVDDFYKAALEAGGKDSGKPGYRKEYHPGYYAAFVLDPDGNNIEAQFDDPERM